MRAQGLLVSSMQTGSLVKHQCVYLAFAARLHSRSHEGISSVQVLGYEMVQTKSLNTISQRSLGKKARTRRRRKEKEKEKRYDRTIKRAKRERSTEWGGGEI